jgi:hypothetical protein
VDGLHVGGVMNQEDIFSVIFKVYGPDYMSTDEQFKKLYRLAKEVAKTQRKKIADKAKLKGKNT